MSPSPETAAAPSRWRLCIDTGGTFTDALGVSPQGETLRAKVLSSSALRGLVLEAVSGVVLKVEVSWPPVENLVKGFTFRSLDGRGESRSVLSFDAVTSTLTLEGPLDLSPGQAFEVSSTEEAPILAARLLTGTPAGQPLPAIALRLATTRGTNALLERRGGKTALFITEGFGDLLEIGNQQRPDLFALEIRRAQPLYDAVVEVRERLSAKGEVLVPLQVEALERRAKNLLEKGFEAAAVVSMHAYRNASHEEQVTEVLSQAGFEHVSSSAELAPRIGLLPRAQTAVVDAYLSPVLRRYLARVGEALVATGPASSSTLHVMTSAGGLVKAEVFRPKDCLLSGPAGGVVGAARSGERSGLRRLISFDMGGTSTDVARFDGDFEYSFDQRVGAAELLAPALAIETVAAGGGSICSFDGGRLRVGPQSAGSLPGPACYGAGGPLTLTDVNLLLGRLDPKGFEIPIRPAAAEEALEALIHATVATTGEEVSKEVLLQGLLEIANERMAEAIRSVSVRRGYDPEEYALVAFGGAGGQHACAIAGQLGMRTVLVPADAALLSALGLGAAVLERFAERQILEPLEKVAGQLSGWFADLEAQARQEVAAQGVPPREVEVRRRTVVLRFLGQESGIAVEFDPLGPSLSAAFTAAHQRLFGYSPGNRPIEVETLRVVASSRSEPVAAPAEVRRTEAAVVRRQEAFFEGEWRLVPVYLRRELEPGAVFRGPALLYERHSATVIETGWEGFVDSAGALVLHRPQIGREASLPTADPPTAAPTRKGCLSRSSNAVELELFTHRFAAIAREMGEMLQRTALSTNVKERLDFSCALLDARGELVVNAPHIPVHLGALGLCVRAVGEVLELGPGDVAVTNHPAFGGSHLPDVTVITPVFSLGTEGQMLLGFVASRAHHGEIGGTRPGSMPPSATCLAEEGVVIPPMYLVRGGQPRWQEMRKVLETSPFPSRAVEENLADLAAAVAANHHGAAALRCLAEVHGAAVVGRYMEVLKDRAAHLMREALVALGDRCLEAREELDDGTPLAVRLEICSGRAVIDLSGSGAVHPGNLNASPAVVRSAVLYVLRLLLAGPLPLNEGLLEPVEIRVPECFLNPTFSADPALCPAVVGGNVETSQRLVDTLLKALGLVAGSQGTMNNLLFGNDHFGYYETLCGGTGAGPGFAGASAVHSHMTNTRITDPEILEQRYPVRLERFAVRRGSGGGGEFSGGDGAVRELTFLESVSLSLLSQRRASGPYGIGGGEAGLPGRQCLFRADGTVDELEGIDSREARPGDRLVVETPGGGGWGSPRRSS